MRMTFGVVFGGALLVFLAVAMAAVFIPGWVYTPPQTTVALPRTVEQERGRIAYYSNGCNYCHTQYGRFWDNSGEPVARGGDYFFDNPMTLGSERTGPDLAYIGRRRGEQWEMDHLRFPRDFSPLSIMPDWYFLPDQEQKDIVAYLFNLGDRVAQERMILPPEPYMGVQDPQPSPLVTAVPQGQSQGWATWAGSGLQEGKELFTSHCLTCHGCAGNGLGHYAGTLFVTPANFKAEPIRSMPDDQWFWHVSEGIPGTVMPTWKASNLTQEQRWSVIRYIQQTFADPIARDPDEGDPTGSYTGVTNPLPLTVDTLQQGKAIWLRECMVCHNDHGQGNGEYSQGLQPPPPNFNDPASYNSYTDADYFWRISEGLPWSAMPSWKTLYSDEKRWMLVHFIRVNFTQTEPRPQPMVSQDYPAIYLAQTMPEGTSFERGKVVYLRNCAKCHGLGGKGNGWGGQYLNPKPADFTDQKLRANSEGTFFAKVSYGVQDSAMPVWHEFMPEGQRWEAIRYLQESFIEGEARERQPEQRWRHRGGRGNAEHRHLDGRPGKDYLARSRWGGVWPVLRRLPRR